MKLLNEHDHDVCDPVWELYEYALQRFGAVSTMIERDDNIPEFPELRKELAVAEKIAGNTLTKEQLQLSNHSLLQGVA
jgi:uncharacterized protein